MKLKNFKKSILESVKLYNKQEPVSTIDNDLVPTVNNIEYQNAKKSKEKAKEREDELKPNIEAADELAKKHALQGYNGITISKERMQEKVKERVGSHIQIDM